MKNDLREPLLKALGTFNRPANIHELTLELVMGEENCDLGAVPFRTVFNHVEDFIRDGGDDCPIIKVPPDEYILRDNAMPDILLNASKKPSTAVKDTERRSGVVTCIGNNWRREKILWTSKPKIIGHQWLTPVDFCEQIGVYTLHGDKCKIVYVGHTADRSLGECLNSHNMDDLEKKWVTFSFFGFRPVADDGTLGQLPRSYKMAGILNSLVKMVLELTYPSLNIFECDYHFSLCFGQWGNPFVG